MLTRYVAKVLSAFWGIDPLQAYLMLDILCVQDRDRVTISDSDDRARDRLGRFARTTAEDAQHGEEE
jgi:hypothetical protein